MQKKIILVIVAIIVVLGIILVLNFNIESEYVPEEEISDVDLRKTIVNLYFEGSNSHEIEKESRLIDSKNLLREPCKELLTMLNEGPENDNFVKAFPDGTKILNVSVYQNVATIDLSSEFVENSKDSNQRKNSVKSIYYTLTELKDVSKIKILIDGKEIDGFVEEGINFKDVIGKEIIESV